MALHTISVVIPTYNGLTLLQRYLSPLYIALQEFEYEVIVVDDASTDTTCAWLQENYPQVKLLVNPQNQGFAETINRGIFEAQNDLVLCLNNDMEVAPDFFTTLVPYFDKPDTFAVMSQVMNVDRNEVIEMRKQPYMKSGMVYVRDDYDNKQGKSFFVCGGNGLYSRAKLQQLGGFPTLYAPCYFEDVHLAVKAWTLGWCSYCDTNTQSYHMHAATMKSIVKQEAIDKLSYRNPIIFNYYFADDLGRKNIIKKYRSKQVFYTLFPFSRRKKLHLNAIREFFAKRSEIDTEIEAFEAYRHKNNLNCRTLECIVKEDFGADRM